MSGLLDSIKNLNPYNKSSPDTSSSSFFGSGTVVSIITGTVLIIFAFIICFYY